MNLTSISEKVIRKIKMATFCITQRMARTAVCFHSSTARSWKTGSRAGSRRRKESTCLIMILAHYIITWSPRRAADMRQAVPEW